MLFANVFGGTMDSENTKSLNNDGNDGDLRPQLANNAIEKCTPEQLLSSQRTPY